MLVAPPYHCGQLLAVDVGAGAVDGGSFWFPDVSCFSHAFPTVLPRFPFQIQMTARNPQSFTQLYGCFEILFVMKSVGKIGQSLATSQGYVTCCLSNSALLYLPVQESLTKLKTNAPLTVNCWFASCLIWFHPFHPVSMFCFSHVFATWFSSKTNTHLMFLFLQSIFLPCNPNSFTVSLLIFSASLANTFNIPCVYFSSRQVPSRNIPGWWFAGLEIAMFHSLMVANTNLYFPGQLCNALYRG